MVCSGKWQGATLLIAPASEQMWKHAGQPPPAFADPSFTLPPTARILTVQGGNDSIVSAASVKRLHNGSRRSQCQLLMIENEDHMLFSSCTKHSLEEWIWKLVSNVSSATQYEKSKLLSSFDVSS
mmetsp:Transcript_26142/g.63006  ORF Transcript_26142/g.63006 Transcript_26142/m.63006 type:complete len:125 (-) Transcript_26142:157-531(-)